MDEFTPGLRRALMGGVLALHLAAAWGLLQLSAVREAVQQVLPLQVDWIAPPAPQPAPPAPAARSTPTPKPERPLPVIAAPQPTTTPATATPEAAVSAPDSVPAPAVASVAPPSPVPPAAPPQPPAPRQIPASALQYLVPPAQAYPLASRRLQEQGTVLVRLVVDATGLPQQVALHRSSGFARLDEQALQALRAARFKPHTDNGVAVPWTAIAPLAYELH